MVVFKLIVYSIEQLFQSHKRLPNWHQRFVTALYSTNIRQQTIGMQINYCMVHQ